MKMVHVPELDDVVLELKALRKDVLEVCLGTTVEERTPTRVGVRQRDNVVVHERICDTLRDDVTLVTIKCKRRCIARLDPGDAGHIQLLTHDAPF
jgi:hypothetical protein